MFDQHADEQDSESHHARQEAQPSDRVEKRADGVGHDAREDRRIDC